jgi:BTB/POZ domain
MITNQTVLLPIGDQSPAITNASSPFDSPDADVILRSSDKVDFRVFKMFIAFASPIFKDIFALPQASKGKSVGEDEMKHHLPIIQMTESSRTIENLLKLCYPTFTSKLPELNIMEDVIALWEAADKYEIEDVMKYARDALVAPPLIEQEAVRIFATALQNR